MWYVVVCGAGGIPAYGNVVWCRDEVRYSVWYRVEVVYIVRVGQGRDTAR